MKVLENRSRGTILDMTDTAWRDTARERASAGNAIGELNPLPIGEIQFHCVGAEEYQSQNRQGFYIYFLLGYRVNAQGEILNLTTGEPEANEEIAYGRLSLPASQVALAQVGQVYTISTTQGRRGKNSTIQVENSSSSNNSATINLPDGLMAELTAAGLTDDPEIMAEIQKTFNETKEATTGTAQVKAIKAKKAVQEAYLS